MLRERPHKQEEKERVRLSLLGAALALSAEHGFASLGLREVSRAAGIAPTSFYRHFADMAELGLALVRDRVEPMLRELAATMTTSDPTASAHGLAEGMLRAVADEPELVRFVIAERSGAFASLRAALMRALDALAIQLQLGAKRPAHARLAADMVLALVLDGFARALDADERDRAALSAHWIAAMSHAWGPP